MVRRFGHGRQGGRRPDREELVTNALLPVRADRSSLVDLTYERLKTALADGHFAAGQRLPSEPQLAAELNVSRATVRSALSMLQQQGHVFRRVGDGTYAADSGQVFVERLELFKAIDSIAADQNVALTPRETRFETVRASASLARQLAVARNARVHRVTRTLVADFGPIVRMTDLIPDSVMTMKVLRAGYTGVLREQLARAIPDIAYADALIFMEAMSAEVAADLEFPVGAMHLVLEETVRTGDDAPVELSINQYSPTRVRFLTRQWRTPR
jgi:GntR family transcriptional regulator